MFFSFLSVFWKLCQGILWDCKFLKSLENKLWMRLSCLCFFHFIIEKKMEFGCLTIVVKGGHLSVLFWSQTLLYKHHLISCKDITLRALWFWMFAFINSVMMLNIREKRDKRKRKESMVAEHLQIQFWTFAFSLKLYFGGLQLKMWSCSWGRYFQRRSFWFQLLQE